MSRSGTGSRHALRMQDYTNAQQLHDVQSVASIRAKSRTGEADDTASLFNYMPRGTPSKSGKSILYRLHNKPRKQLNIIDGNTK